MRGKLTDIGSGWTTLADVLEQRASLSPSQVAFVFEDDARKTEQWTYGQLDARARGIAAWLAERGEVGDRAILIYPPGLEFIAAFFGCIYAGMLPVPATYPKPRRPLPRLDAIVGDCQPRLALTHSSVLDGLEWEGRSPSLGDVPVEATDGVAAFAAASFCPIKRQTDDLAFLQYTSGSTSEPRGVMVTHRNLLHNLESISDCFSIETANDQIPTSVFWLPAYHDMGLIGGILAPMYVGGRSYLLAPSTFLRRPLRWLEIMSETRASASGAPNFGYELVLQKTTPEERVGLDLQDWQLAFCGAEPIHPQTLQEFASALASTGFRSEVFYPCYGLAEVTLLATGGDGPAQPRIITVDRQELARHRVARVEESEARAQSFVSCGSPRNGNTITIVDPRSRSICQDDRVGEIWVRGQSVAQGYWNQEQASLETFQASLNGAGTGDFLRTGDLGFCLDGNLYVTGRIKDVVIIRGRNHYPQDIERTAEKSHEAVDLGAVFSVEGKRHEQLVVVHQLHREHRRANAEEVIRTIRKSIVDQHELDPHAIVLIRPASLPITTSGKVQRSRCREQYLAGELSVVAEWTNAFESDATEEGRGTGGLSSPPVFLKELSQADPARLKSDVQSWLIAWLTERANLLPGAMASATPFAELGIDSLTAVEISQEMDQVLGLRLPPMVIWSYPTAEELSGYLVEQLMASGNPAAGNGSVSNASATRGQNSEVASRTSGNSF